VGASAALSLAERGHDVTLFEARGPGHKLGSSHGLSRIVRRAYPDEFYTALMEQAYPLWGELEEKCGERLLHEVGLLYFGCESSPTVCSMLRALGALGVRHSVLGPAECGEAMAGLRVSPNEIGILTPEAGWVDAARAWGVTVRLALDAGVVVRGEASVSVESLEAGFDAVGLAVGPWIRRWVDVPVRVTLQTFAYLDVPERDGPVWIEDGGSILYGFPYDPRAAGMKIGMHLGGQEIDPDEPERVPSAEVLASLQEFCARRLGEPDARVLTAEGCLYTSTANEDFLVGSAGERTWFVSACSGHGFKFGPWSGRLLADFMLGLDSPRLHERFYWEG